MEIRAEAALVGGAGRERPSAVPRRRWATKSARRRRAAGVPPGASRTGATLRSSGSEATSPSRSSSGAGSNGGAGAVRSITGARAAARHSHASANARWIRGRSCAAAETAGPRRLKGTMPLVSTATTATSVAAARAAVWAGTMKAGKSSVTTSAARAARIAMSPRPSPARRSTQGQ